MNFAKCQVLFSCALRYTTDLLKIKISWWRHQMETFSALLAICAGNSPVHVEFPAQRPVTRSFDVPLICARIYGWANNHEAGDLRRHHSHYDVIVMCHVANFTATGGTGGRCWTNDDTVGIMTVLGYHKQQSKAQQTRVSWDILYITIFTIYL